MYSRHTDTACRDKRITTYRVTYRHEDSTDITYCYIDTLNFDPKVHTSRQTIHSLENLSPIQTFDVHILVYIFV